ncbi:MAG: hypothetical protein WBW11_13545 [Pseudolabrys sp.]|jgi:hypothetical protein
MPLLIYLPLIVWMGLFKVAQDEMRIPVKGKTLDEQATKCFRIRETRLRPSRRVPVTSAVPILST